MCGGTSLITARACRSGGLSPRVRGHPCRKCRPDRRPWTIPACAGAPQSEVAAAYRWQDYPRGCGGTCGKRMAERTITGLSPRVRGHRRPGRIDRAGAGTIPAGAGAPRLSTYTPHHSKDYPRGCGGTQDLLPEPFFVTGLSPRVRGHPLPSAAGAAPKGTIPAGAGTPWCRWPSPSKRKDYPRGCGDTQVIRIGDQEIEGLSPRVRGHLHVAHEVGLEAGTIPAGAGTPHDSLGLFKATGDYPRGCGDTQLLYFEACHGWGLSPRVRGHQAGRAAPDAGRGTIPAGAGTPVDQDVGPGTLEDYPRGCGDTSTGGVRSSSGRGLSPRVRGHLLKTLPPADYCGTIPAGAGTPYAPAFFVLLCGDLPAGIPELKYLQRGKWSAFWRMGRRPAAQLADEVDNQHNDGYPEQDPEDHHPPATAPSPHPVTASGYTWLPPMFVHHRNPGSTEEAIPCWGSPPGMLPCASQSEVAYASGTR